MVFVIVSGNFVYFDRSLFGLHILRPTFQRLLLKIPFHFQRLGHSILVCLFDLFLLRFPLRHKLRG